MDSPKPNTNQQRKLSVAEAKANLRAISSDSHTPPTPAPKHSSVSNAHATGFQASSGGVGSVVSSSLFESGMALIRRYPKRSIAAVLIGGVVLGRSSHARSAVRWGVRQAMLVRSVTKLLS